MAENDNLDPHDGGENVGAAGLQTEKTADEKPAPEVSEDGNIVKIGDKTYITKQALDAERAERQQLAEALNALEPVMPEFEEFLKGRGKGGGGSKDRATARRESSDYTDDELEGFAATRGYHLDDGSPDLGRAQKELDLLAKISNRQVSRGVAPVTQSARAESARLNRERAAAGTFVDGQPVADTKYLDAAFKAVGDDYAADPNVANLVQVVAAGLEYLDKRKSGTLGRRGRDPMHVEGGSGHFDGHPDNLSSLDLAAARARGKTPEQWAKSMKAATGRSDVLEEV